MKFYAVSIFILINSVGKFRAIIVSLRLIILEIARGGVVVRDLAFLIILK